MIFVGFVYLRGTQNKYFIAYFTLILHKTKPSAWRISLYNLRLP